LSVCYLKKRKKTKKKQGCLEKKIIPQINTESLIKNNCKMVQSTVTVKNKGIK